MRVGLAQVNPTVGDIDGNARLVLDHVDLAKESGCDLVLFPELCLTGYPPEDLLLKPAFTAKNERVLRDLAKRVRDIAAIVGYVGTERGRRTNAAAWIENGRVAGVYHKRRLPNYGVFDERRYFAPGEKPFLRTLKGVRVGVTVCEDIWIPGDHLTALKKLKADVVVNISASPFHVRKQKERRSTFKATARATGAALIYCNMVGGQDELVFDGGSLALAKNGALAAQFPAFQTGLHLVDVEKKGTAILLSSPEKRAADLSGVEEIYEALLLGLRDYVRKNGFSRVALGLSGGIDSALVAALAAEALGAKNVVGVTMPSKYNLSETISDAAAVAKNLGIEFHEISIQPLFQNFLKTLDPLFQGTKPNIAEENLQARIRGTLMMALSNKFGWLVLTTGNKSETSTGYCTLYGDTAGGFAVIKDVLKTTVYALSRFINEKAGRELIPETTVKRAPTAELRADQRDEDSLGPYSQLDPVVVDYVEKNRSSAATDLYARRIESLIDRSEYKRRQAPPGIKITPRSFGRDHRMPITNRYAP